MKNKILLVGKISEILGSIHDALDSEFDVQMCSFQMNSTASMVKVLRPSMIVVCTVGIYDFDEDFVNWIDKGSGTIPVVFIVKKEDMELYIRLCHTARYSYLNPPINLDTIVDTCKSIMSGNVPEARSDEPKVKKRQILTIDDSAMVLRYVKNVLKDEFEVLLATSGEMGLKKAQEVKPDLILLDYEMPGMDGRETFLNLKVEEETENIPVIFLTSVSDTKKVKEVLDMHPAGYILKPMDADQLLTKVHKALNITGESAGAASFDIPAL